MFGSPAGVRAPRLRNPQTGEPFAIPALVRAQDTFFTFVRSELRASRLRIRRKEVKETAIPSHSTPDKGCSPCAMHQSTAEAYLLLLGLAYTYQEEGQIPPGVSGTIHRACSLFQDAEAGAATVGAKEPRLRAEALPLQGHIAGLTA